jgi:hypothetical protein
LRRHSRTMITRSSTPFPAAARAPGCYNVCRIRFFLHVHFIVLGRHADGKAIDRRMGKTALRHP